MWQNSPKVLMKIFSNCHLEHGMWWHGERSRGNCLSTFGSNSNLSNMWLSLFNFWLLMIIWKDVLRQCWWDEIMFHKFYAEIEGEGGRVRAFLWILIHIWTSSTNWCSPESKQSGYPLSGYMSTGSFTSKSLCCFGPLWSKWLDSTF